ncbi:MAG: hypothetical protein JWQ79_4150 [Mucilaginibacter sp.]|nr:hypothetical protein [Mucilaginibacter sp.]
MTHDIFKNTTGMTWEEAASKSHQLFFEAHCLDRIAYAILKTETLSPQVWVEFLVAKSEAEKKYIEARHEWHRIRQILDSLKSSAE